MFKHKRRSAHGFFSSAQPVPISRPIDAADTVKASSMGSVGEQAQTYYGDSVIAGASPKVNAKVHGDFDGRVDEPLVMDFATLHDGINPSTPPIASPSSRADESWPSDDDITAAAPPPEFSGRDIHVPLRTR